MHILSHISVAITIHFFSSGSP